MIISIKVFDLKNSLRSLDILVINITAISEPEIELSSKVKKPSSAKSVIYLNNTYFYYSPETVEELKAKISKAFL